MAISDTLSDAAEEIRDYIHNQPSMYASVFPELQALLAHMDAVRIALDKGPFDDPTGPMASVFEALQSQVYPRRRS